MFMGASTAMMVGLHIPIFVPSEIDDMYLALHYGTIKLPMTIMKKRTTVPDVSFSPPVLVVDVCGVDG